MVEKSNYRVDVWLMIFKRKYADMILNGEKFLEIRWSGTENIDKVKPGDYVLMVARVSEGVIGLAKVVDVCLKSIKEFSDVDAMNAGFSNRDEMIRELFQIYPIKSLDETYYLIRLVPLLDLRDNPVKLEELGIKLSYWDIRGRVVKLDTKIIEQILRRARRR